MYSIFKDFVAASLSKNKHLVGGVEFVEAIPKSAAGKILRKDLKASYMIKYKKMPMLKVIY